MSFLNRGEDGKSSTEAVDKAVQIKAEIKRLEPLMNDRGVDKNAVRKRLLQLHNEAASMMLQSGAVPKAGVGSHLTAANSSAPTSFLLNKTDRGGPSASRRASEIRQEIESLKDLRDSPGIDTAAVEKKLANIQGLLAVYKSQTRDTRYDMFASRGGSAL